MNDRSCSVMTCHDMSCRTPCDICPASHNCLRCRTCSGSRKHVPAPLPPSLPLSTNNLMNVEPTTVRRHRRSELDRWRILVYFDDGQTISQIAIQLKCSRNTVYRWIRAYFRNDMNELKGSRGRKRKLAPDTVATIVEHVKRVKFITPREIKYFFDLDVCNRTIDRRLIENNLFGRVARTRHPFMNPKKRLSFAHGKNVMTCPVMTGHDMF
jgi:transposase